MEPKIKFNGDGITTVQVAAILLKLVGVPYFAKASWLIILSPTIITLLISIIIVVIISNIN